MSASFYSNNTATGPGQVNYTSMLLARVGSITRLISVSSYLVMCSVLQSAPLSLALEVLLGLPSPHGAGAMTVTATVTPSKQAAASPHRLSTPQPSHATPVGIASSATPSAPVTPTDSERRSLDETLSAIYSSLILVVNNTLADDLNPGGGVGKSSSAAHTPAKPTAAGALDSSVSLDMHTYTEFAARNILSRLPGKALWSLLSSDPTLSALSPALMASLQACADQQSSNGVIEVLQRRLGSFLSMKFDEQVALGALLQRTVCLLSVVVLACQNNAYDR